MSKYFVELEFESDPTRLLAELGLRTKQFQRVKENILTRLVARPEISMIVLEFQPSGMYYGEVKYGERERYTEARKRRSEAIGRAARRDQSGPEESAIDGDDGVSDGETDRSGWGLESVLRRQIARRGSQREAEADGWG